MARSRDAGYVSAFEVDVAYTEIKDESYKSHSVSRTRTRDHGYVSKTAIAGFVDESFEPIATTTVGSGGAASVTFSSIPATYKHLQLRILAGNSVSNYMGMVMNSDTGSNYAFHRLSGDGATADANNVTSRADMILTGAGAMATTANVFGGFIVDILDYANTNKYKTVRCLNGYDQNGSGYINLSSNVWLNTAAVTSLVLSSASNFRQYSSFALYGIKG